MGEKVEKVEYKEKKNLNLKKFLKYRTFWKSGGYLKKITYPKTDITSNYIKLHVIFFSLYYGY